MVHGPLLGWAKMMGDNIVRYKQPGVHGSEPIAYMMPSKPGVEFLLYPWHTHLHDACEGAKVMLTLFGEWTFSESVAQAGPVWQVYEIGQCMFFFTFHPFRHAG